MNLDMLARHAKIKFDHHLDPIQLGVQYMKACTLKDYPVMLQKIKPEAWQRFFLGEAKKLSKKILK